MTLARRLLLGTLIVVGALVVFVVAVADRRLHEQLITFSAAQLTREARLVALQWTPRADPDQLADAAAGALGHRVTLVALDGRVVGDSELDGEALLRLESYGDRPEIEAARRDGSGSARRRSPRSGTEELYVAVAAPLGVVRVSVGGDALARVIGQAQRSVLAAGAMAMVAAVFLVWLFARSVSRPLVELRNVAQAIAAGDLTSRAPLSAPGEIGDLAVALHRLAEQLATRLAALEADDALVHALVESLHEGVLAVDPRRQVVRINAGGRRLLGVREPVPLPADLLPRNRTLRAALDRALAGQATPPTEFRAHGYTMALTAIPLPAGGAVVTLFDLTALRRLEAVRRDFVANVSHELKTPLTVIHGFAETLVDDDPPPEQRRRFAEAIVLNAQRMQRIVNDLLDLSRIESGGWVPQAAPMPLAAAARDAILPLAAKIAGARIHVDVDVPPDVVVHADATALRQILFNLVDNAVRHTPAEGRVAITAEREEGGLWLRVRDTGTGVAPEHLPRIFERFYRVDPGRAREAGGTGLGLAIVRHLVEAHGGRVHAASTIGQGTTISAFFPDTLPDPAAPV